MVSKKYNPFTARAWRLAHGRSLELGPKSRIMGILNVTPDSFSDGGRFVDLELAIEQATRMIDEGADIIDVGGESTKPNADAVSEQQEQDRVLPVIEALSKKSDCLISIDTYRATTAKLALASGAHLINDVWGLQYDTEMGVLVEAAGAGICIVHNSRDRETKEDLVEDQTYFLNKSLKNAEQAGIKRGQIVLDPGFGFGKEVASDNLGLLNRFGELNQFELPLLAGTSRKRFTGSLLSGEDSEFNRDIVTSATSVIARMAGCQLFRVHNVAINKHALMLADAVLDSE